MPSVTNDTNLNGDGGNFDVSINQTLPRELLAAIFVACYSSCIMDKLCYPLSHSVPPLLVCQVCSLWRMIAIRTPRLWVDLQVSVDYRVDGGRGYIHNSQEEIIQLWGSRIGVLRPSLFFKPRGGYIRRHTEDDVVAYYRPFLFVHSILQPTSLLSFYDLSHLDSDAIVTWLSMVETHPCLQYLSIYQTQRSWSTSLLMENPSKRINPSKMPKNLRMLFFSARYPAYSKPYDKRLDIFSWSSLTHLAAQLCLPISQWYTILHECSSLTHLKIKLHADLSRQIRNDVEVRPKLQEIIAEVDFGDISLLFRGFVFPSVAKLRIFSSKYAQAGSLISLNNMLFSTPNLEELHTQGVALVSNFLTSYREYHKRGTMRP